MAIDPLDSLIVILVTLLILSIITEKLTQLVRSYARQIQLFAIVSSLLFFVLIFRSCELDIGYYILFISLNSIVLFYALASISVFFSSGKFDSLARLNSYSVLRNINKDSNQSSDQVKESEITILSFLIGFGVSIAFNTDLIKLFSNLFQESKSETFHLVGWMGEQPIDFKNFRLSSIYFNKFNLLPLVGFIATAFFLSFGSKFFHDLLDTLFQVKQLKRKLNDKETYKIDNIKDFDEYIAATEGDIVQKSIEQNNAQLRAVPGYLNAYVGVGMTPTGKQYIACVDVKGKLLQKPAHIDYTFSSGRKKKIPVMIFENSGSVKPNYGKVENPQLNNYIGSVACSVVDANGGYHFLTCAHVLTGGRFDDSMNNQSMQIPVEVDINGAKIPSTWYYGYQDHEYDIALVRPNQVASPPSVQATPIDSTLDMLGASLHFRGATSPHGTGYLFAHNVETDITFANKTVRMFGLIKTTQYVAGKFLPIASGGDSGSLLLDNQNNALGIILGSDDNFTYAISIYKILLGSNYKIN